MSIIIIIGAVFGVRFISSKKELLTILFTLIKDIGLIAELTNFTLFITFAVINMAVVVLRFKMPKEKRAFKMPFNIGSIPVLAIVGFISCVFLLAQLSLPIIIGGVALAFTGVLTYIATTLFEYRAKIRR